MNIKKRQHFLDVLRVSATCAVVMFHTVTGTMDNTDMAPYPFEHRFFLAVKDLTSWCVPIFLLISGYLFLDPDRELTFSKMVTKYCRRVALALLLFGVPFAWLELAATAGHFRPSMLWQGIVRILQGDSWAHMWYLYLILFLYLFTPAIRWALKRMSIPAVYGVAAAMFMGSSILSFFRDFPESWWSWSLPGAGIYLFYYLCGYFFACHKQRSSTGFPLTCGLAILLAVGMAASRLAGFSMITAYNYPFTVLLTLCMFSAAITMENIPARKAPSPYTQQDTGLWERAAGLCFAVYLIHPVFLNIAYKFLNITPLSFNVVVSLPLFFLGALLLSATSAWILCKIPPLRKYVL